VDVTTVKVTYGQVWDAVKTYRITVKKKRR
jgi:hypothetical protein